MSAAGFARRGVQAVSEEAPMESRHGAEGAGLSIVDRAPYA
jgi:hypothetical protein